MRNSIALLLLLIVVSAKGQTVTFNKRFHFGSNNAHLAAVIPTDSCIYATGMVMDTFGTNHPANLFAKFDLEGNLLLSKVLYSPSRWLYTLESAFVQTHDHQFAGLVLGLDSIRHFMLIKYHENGDTVFVKSYEHPQYPAESFVYSFSMVSTSAGGFMMVGNMENQNALYSTDVLAMMADSAGNILWKKSYGSNFADFGTRVINDGLDGGFIIGGARHNFTQATQGYLSRSMLFHVDSAGTKGWEHLSPFSELMDWAYDAVQLEDGSLVVASGAGTEIDLASWNVVWFDKGVFKMSPNGEIVWKKIFVADYLSGSNRLTNIERASDGSGFVVAGEHHEPLPDLNTQTIWGWVSKLSNEGDSLWTRVFAFDTIGWLHKVYGFEECPDGGFLLCGSTEPPFLSEPIIQQGWLLKLDQHGCLVPGCHLPNASTEAGQRAAMNLAIYPNPTSDYLNFQVRNWQPEKGVIFRVVNTDGRVLKEIPHLQAELTYIVPVWEWPSGAYFLQCHVNGTLLCSETFIKK